MIKLNHILFGIIVLLLSFHFYNCPNGCILFSCSSLFSSPKKLAVFAFGGNALLRSGQKGSAEEQLENVYETCQNLIPFLKEEDGYNIVIAHGNGPQVGVNLLKNEAAFSSEFALPKFPMYICGAETQGFIGYMIESQLKRVLKEHGIERNVITIVTQTEVDASDEAFAHPRKPVGQFYPKEQADILAKENNWIFKEDKKRGGWRRVVPSPRPIAINNADLIEELAREGNIVIAVGGGGIPVVRNSEGIQEGVDAVIDKDLASSFLAQQIEADEFFIFTDVSNVYVNFNKPNQKKLEEVTTEELKEYLDENEFGEGSMKPKIKAVIEFVEHSKKENGKATITDPSAVSKGEKGTIIRKKITTMEE